MSRRSIRIATDRYRKKSLENNGRTFDLDSSDSEDSNGIGREVNMVGQDVDVGQQVDGEVPEVDGVAQEVGDVLGQEADVEVEQDSWSTDCATGHFARGGKFRGGTKSGEEVDPINERMSAFEQGLKEVKEEISMIHKSNQSAARDRIFLYNLITKK